MEETLNNLKNIVQDKPVKEIIVTRYLNAGLIQKVSWTQYVITYKGSKLINILETNGK